MTTTLIPPRPDAAPSAADLRVALTAARRERAALQADGDPGHRPRLKALRARIAALADDLADVEALESAAAAARAAEADLAARRAALDAVRATLADRGEAAVQIEAALEALAAAVQRLEATPGRVLAALHAVGGDLRLTESVGRDLSPTMWRQLVAGRVGRAVPWVQPGTYNLDALARLARPGDVADLVTRQADQAGRAAAALVPATPPAARETASPASAPAPAPPGSDRAPEPEPADDVWLEDDPDDPEEVCA